MNHPRATVYAVLVYCSPCRLSLETLRPRHRRNGSQRHLASIVGTMCYHALFSSQRYTGFSCFGIFGICRALVSCATGPAGGFPMGMTGVMHAHALAILFRSASGTRGRTRMERCGLTRGDSMCSDGWYLEERGEMTASIRCAYTQLVGYAHPTTLSPQSPHNVRLRGDPDFLSHMVSSPAGRTGNL